MPSPDNLPPLVVLVGPTAVGKTARSVLLAERLNGEIVSADSRLFYRGMDIGTAKPTAEERSRVPHHLVDFLNPDEPFSLAEFQAEVYRVTDDIRARGQLPIVVGGTGQYIRSLTEGWEIPAEPPRPELREALERIAGTQTKQFLYHWLEVLDPTAARKIDSRNLRRTIRALEVVFSTGRAFSAQRRTGKVRFRSLVIGLIRPRAELYERIDRRINAMFEAGLMDEVRRLMDAGYAPDLPAMSAIGYREAVGVLSGTLSQLEAKASMKKRSRSLVRRQANWFKADDPEIRWFSPEEDLEPVVRDFLKGQ